MLLYEKCDLGDLLKVELIKYADANAHDWIYNNINECVCLKKESNGVLTDPYIYENIDYQYEGKIYEPYLKLLFNTELNDLNYLSINYHLNFKGYLLQNSFYGKINKEDFDNALKNKIIDSFEAWIKDEMQIKESINSLLKIEKQEDFAFLICVLHCIQERNRLIDINLQINKETLLKFDTYFRVMPKLNDGLMAFYEEEFRSIYPQFVNLIILPSKLMENDGFIKANQYLIEEFQKRNELEDFLGYYRTVLDYLKRNHGKDISKFTVLYNEDYYRKAIPGAVNDYALKQMFEEFSRVYNETQGDFDNPTLIEEVKKFHDYFNCEYSLRSGEYLRLYKESVVKWTPATHTFPPTVNPIEVYDKLRPIEKLNLLTRIPNRRG